MSAEIEALDAQLARLVAQAAPALVAVKGVGNDTAVTLLAAAGDKPRAAAQRGRLRPPVWGGPRPRLVRQDHVVPPQPGRQPGAPPPGRAPAGLGPAQPRLLRLADGPGQGEAGDPQVPETLLGPRELSAPHEPAARRP